MKITPNSGVRGTEGVGGNAPAAKGRFDNKALRGVLAERASRGELPVYQPSSSGALGIATANNTATAQV